MRQLPTWLAASVVLLVILAPIAAVSDQLPAPLEKTIMPGTSTLHYAGQSLRFTTDVALRVGLLSVGEGRVRLTFRVHSSAQGSGGASPAGTSVDIFWEDWNNSIYNGPAPTSQWEGILLTESGYTEK